MAAAENERGGNGPGAGAAPGPQKGQPRALPKRGGRGNRSAGFYASLGQIPPISRAPAFPAIRQPSEFREWTDKESQTRGEFRAQAVWISAADTSDAGDLAADGDTQLDGILAAIVSEVQGKAVGARAAVMAEYGGKIAFARKYFTHSQVASAIRAFKDAQAAALALIAKQAEAEIASRRETAIRSHRNPSRDRGVLRGPKRPEGPNIK
jgi:hypothetical protein